MESKMPDIYEWHEKLSCEQDQLVFSLPPDLREAYKAAFTLVLAADITHSLITAKNPSAEEIVSGVAALHDRMLAAGEPIERAEAELNAVRTQPFHYLGWSFSNAHVAAFSLAEEILEAIWRALYPGKVNQVPDLDVALYRSVFQKFAVVNDSLEPDSQYAAFLQKYAEAAPRFEATAVVAEMRLEIAWLLRNQKRSPPEQAAGISGQRTEKQSKLSPSREKAYSQYTDAVRYHSTEMENETDAVVYEWVKEHVEQGEGLPTLATWSKYLREARNHYQTPKHSPRRGRETGKSVVRQEERD
jgi:hypothetical protein